LGKVFTTQRRKEFCEERKDFFKKILIFNMKKGKDFRIFTFFILKILACFAFQNLALFV